MWNGSSDVTSEINLMNEGVNHKTKGSQIKFSECIWLGAPGINLDADTFPPRPHTRMKKNGLDMS
jgi:hypothetical protein